MDVVTHPLIPSCDRGEIPLSFSFSPHPSFLPLIDVFKLSKLPRALRAMPLHFWIPAKNMREWHRHSFYPSPFPSPTRGEHIELLRDFYLTLEQGYAKF